MYSNWGAAAQALITRIAEDFRPDTPWQERRKQLRRHASEFHAGTSWGKKVWSRECRKYLERHGMPPRTVNPRSNDAQRIFAPDIIFPFRAS